MGRNPVSVCRDQCNRIGAVFQHITRCQFADGGSLARTCRANQCIYTTFIKPLLIRSTHARNKHFQGLFPTIFQLATFMAAGERARQIITKTKFLEPLCKTLLDRVDAGLLGLTTLATHQIPQGVYFCTHAGELIRIIFVTSVLRDWLCKIFTRGPVQLCKGCISVTLPPCSSAFTHVANTGARATQLILQPTMTLCLHLCKAGSVSGLTGLCAQALARHIFVVVQRGYDLNTAVYTAIGKDDSIWPHLLTDLLQSFSHAFGKKTFNFHDIASSNGHALSALPVLSSASLLAHGRHDRNLFVIGYFLVGEHMQPLHTVTGKLGEHRPQGPGYQQDGRLTQHFLTLHAVLQ